MKPRLFINFRRDDTGPVAFRLADELQQRLEPGQIFIDRKGIKKAERWPDRLREELDACSVFFCLIGRQWHKVYNEDTGQRRLDEDGDWVREEIEAALQRYENGQIKLVPLFVDRTSPDAKVYPKSIQKLSEYQGRQLRSEPLDWNNDVDILVKFLLNEQFQEVSPAGPILVIPEFHWNPDSSPPGALLRPDHDRAVPFHFREAEIHSLNTWLQVDRPIATRLYTGPGGRGKTRLLLETCKLQKQDGWLAGFIDQEDPEIIHDNLGRALEQGSNGVLAVIDYAEMRLGVVAAVLETVSAFSETKVRIVLLARSVGEWWDRLKTKRGAVSQLLFHGSTERLRLDPVASSEAARQESFKKAARTFSKILDRPQPHLAMQDLDATYYDEVLLIHSAALAAIKGVKVRGDQGLLDYIISRERRFWTEKAHQQGFPVVFAKAISQSMAAITLAGGAESPQDAKRVLRQIPVLSDQPEIRIESISRLLHEIYPGKRWIEPLLPDLLGEHLIQVEMNECPDLLDAIVRYHASDG